MKKETKLKILDSVIQQMTLQGDFSYDHKLGECKYRYISPETGELRKCAVGMLIPDSEYCAEFEGQVVPHHFFNRVYNWKDSNLHLEFSKILTAAIGEEINEDGWAFLGELQSMHDSVISSIDKFEKYIRRLEEFRMDIENDEATAFRN
jgi:hypothetical protein